MPGPNTKVKNPDTGGIVFGHVPDLPNAGIEGGPIYLPYGKHISAGRGFGFIHIWQGHEKEIRPLGYETQADVTRYVLDIIRPGSKIFDEGQILAHPKVTILRNKKGICILQNNADWSRGVEPHYTVTTAYPKENPHGSLVGQLGGDCMAVATEANR